MQFRISLLAFVVATTLSACSKQEAPEKSAAPSSAPVSQSPFQRNGELLTINVENMPRAVFVAKMAELTGVKITAEGDNTLPVTVHAVDATLRKVLSMAVADAPYAVTMQYTNLQDSFPATVAITRYKSAVASQSQQPAPTAVQLQSSVSTTAPATTAAVAPVESEADQPDIAAMKPDEQISYFMSQPTEEQVSIIFNMEPTAAESELMTQLIAKPEVSSEVKMEILDSLSNGEYEDGAPAIKMALESDNPDVATKAAETLAGIGSAKDIPALKKLADSTQDENVRNAAKEAIESLEP